MWWLYSAQCLDLGTRNASSTAMQAAARATAIRRPGAILLYSQYPGPCMRIRSLGIEADLIFHRRSAEVVERSHGPHGVRGAIDFRSL
jgi:hypothetical protein